MTNNLRLWQKWKPIFRYLHSYSTFSMSDLMTMNTVLCVWPLSDYFAGFWMLWMLLIIFCCFCVFRHRRIKLRTQQEQRQREINLIAYNEACTYPSSMLDLSTSAQTHLPVRAAKSGVALRKFSHAGSKQTFFASYRSNHLTNVNILVCGKFKG